jgi:hypothetical protein
MTISQFKKYTPFSCQTIRCDFDKFPQLKNKTGTGDVFDLTVPRHGDLIKNMYLRFGFTPPDEIIGLTHGFVPSIHMFERFELIVGDTVIETLYPEFINIYYNTFIDFSKKKGNIPNLGPIHHNRDLDAVLPDDSERIIYNTPRTFVVGLPFYFSMDISQSFPLCALHFQELIVRVHMRGLQEIVQLPLGTTSLQYESSLDSVKLTHMYMDVEYVYLGNEEFKYFSNNPHMYTFVQTQEEQHKILQSEASTSKVFRLELDNPISELFFYILHDNKLRTNLVDKNEIFTDDDGHPIESVSLDLDGTTYIDETVADSTFLTQINYMLNHSSVFEHNTVTNNMYVYNYSFSCDPESHAPTGTVNFTQVKNQNLKVNFRPVTTEVNKTLFILARSTNVIMFKDGVAQLLFKNVS